MIIVWTIWIIDVMMSVGTEPSYMWASSGWASATSSHKRLCCHWRTHAHMYWNRWSSV